MRSIDRIGTDKILLLSIMQPNKIVILIALIILTYGQVCAPSQYFNGQRCAPCRANCYCTQQYGCSSCMSGYTYDAKFQNCIQCPTATSATNVGCGECCNQIIETAFVCSKCPALSSTYLLGGQCIRIQGCAGVTSDGRCYSCSSGYYLSDGNCLACDASCATCSDPTFCLTCTTGYYNATNANYGNCAACSVGCSTCTASGCTACLQRYRLAGSTCTACTSNCLACSATACSSCETGYALIGNVCYACTSVAQGGTAGCLTCDTNAGSIKCTKCNSGYYLSLLGACSTCHSRFANSVLCTPTAALQCKDDYVPTLADRYYLVSGQCVANTNKCKAMANTAGACASCYFQSSFGYYKLSGSACVQCSLAGCATFNRACICLSCQSGYQFVNSQCIACQNLHCSVCQNNVRSCQVCVQGYGLTSTACIRCTQAACLNCDGDTSKCVTCQTGYYNNAGICYRCQASCTTCLSSTLCTACNNGYYLMTNGRCKSMPTNCVQVNEKGECSKCAYGYMTLFGNCVPCSTSLFNLNQCSRFCPNYYAELQFQSYFKHVTLLVLALALLMLMQL